MILRNGQKISYEGHKLEILVNEPKTRALAIAVVTGNEAVGGAYFKDLVTMADDWAQQNRIECPSLGYESKLPLYAALIRLIEEANKEGATRAFIRNLSFLERQSPKQ